MTRSTMRLAALLLAVSSAFSMGVVPPGAPLFEPPEFIAPEGYIPAYEVPAMDAPLFEPSERDGKADASIAPSAHMSYEELVGDDKKRGAPPKDFPDKDTYSIVIDKENKVMTVYNKEDDTIARQMLCTIGKPETPSPRGTYKIGKHRVRFGRFEDFDCCAQYWTQLTRNVYIHSVLYNEKSAKTLIRQSYRELGKAASHGCIRLTVPDAKWIYENIAPGTQCKFIRAEKDEALRESLRLPPIPKKKK